MGPLGKMNKYPIPTPENVEKVVGTLFSPPSKAEVESVISNIFNVRNAAKMSHPNVEASLTEGGFIHRVVSHVIPDTVGQRHYLYTREPEAGTTKFLLWCHPGYNGIDVTALDHFDGSILPDLTLKNEYGYIVPSYRGETLHAGNLGSFQSGGEVSIANYDVDDAYIPFRELSAGATSRRVFGSSRGATVAYLASIRMDLDAIDYKTFGAFGGASCLLDYVKDAVMDYIDNGTLSSDRVVMLVLDVVIKPYLSGILSYEDAREQMILRSPACYVEYMDNVACHHGDADQVVQDAHSIHLTQELTAKSKTTDYVSYKDGVHSLDSLTGVGTAINAWFA